MLQDALIKAVKLFVSRAGAAQLAEEKIVQADIEEGGDDSSRTPTHTAAEQSAEQQQAVAGLAEAEAVVEALEALLLDGVRGTNATTLSVVHESSESEHSDDEAARGLPGATAELPAAAPAPAPSSPRKQSAGTKIKNLIKRKGGARPSAGFALWRFLQMTTPVRASEFTTVCSLMLLMCLFDAADARESTMLSIHANVRS